MVLNFTQGTEHNTIQDAVDNAGPNDRLLVGAGLYEEAAVVDVEGLEIIGAGSDLVSVDGATDDAFTVEASSVTIRGFSLYGYRGIRFTEEVVDGTILIADNYVQATDSAAIAFCYSGAVSGSDITITGNEIDSLDAAGIRFGGYDPAMENSTILVANNTINAYGCGIKVYGYVISSTVTVMGNGIFSEDGGFINFDYDVEDSTVTLQSNVGSAYRGIIFEDDIVGSTVTVDSNEITVTANRAGIAFCDDVTDSAVNIADNTVTGNEMTWGCKGINVYYLRADAILTVVGNVVMNFDHGMYMYDVNDSAAEPIYALIESNTFESNGVGLYIEDIYATDPDSSFVIIGNEFLDNVDYGLRFYCCMDLGDGLVVEENKFVGNGFGLSNETGSEIDATANWWGDGSGPTHSSNPDGTGDEVSDDVLFDPWYIDEDMTILSDD